MNRVSRLLLLTLLITPVSLPAQAGEKSPGKAPAEKADKAQGKDGPAGEKVDFEKQIFPLIERSCLKCHSTAAPDENGKMKKPKGGVTLDSKDGMMKSKKGKLVVGKKPADSKMIAAISLPEDDEDHMPPKGKADQLSKEEIELIHRWVEQGADFGSWTGAKKDEKEKPGEKKGAEKKGEAKEGGRRGSGGE